MSSEDATQKRFSASATRLAELSASRIDSMRDRLRSFIALDGSERVLDVGTGAGTLALALAPLVHEVVGLDVVPEMLAEAKKGAADYPNVSFAEGDCMALPLQDGEFDVTTMSRTIHHLSRPELSISEMVRVTRPGGRVLMIDQIASVDPLEALAQNQIESLRDPSHVRVLSDADFRGLFESNYLVLRRSNIEREDWDLGEWFDVAVCDEETRSRVTDFVEQLVARGSTAGINLRRSGDGYVFTLQVGWYLLSKPSESFVEPLY